MAMLGAKVAVIEPVGGHGGMDYYDFGLCGGLAAAGVDVVLHTCDETMIPEAAGFEVRRSYINIFDKSPAWQRGLRYLSGTLTALLSAVREGRKICHFHLFHVGMISLLNVLLARIVGRKVVITAHDVESFVAALEVPWMSRIAYKLADKVIAHNQISRNELTARLKIPAEKIVVIPHGNYLHALRPLPAANEARRLLGVSTRAKVILFFGQIKDVKGLDLLLEAMPEVLKVHPDAILLIAGKPWKTDFSAYQEKLDFLGIKDACVTHIRYIPDEDVPLYYGAADLVVLPYRRIYQSGVILMAMSYGKVVLVSDLPGMTEIVRNGENGFVFAQGDVQALTTSLNQALADSSQREKMAAKGFALMRDEYDWHVIGMHTRELYVALEDAA